MADIRLGPFLVGIDHVSPEVAMPEGSLRDAVNVDLDREGLLTLRPGLTPALPTDAQVVLWQAEDGRCYAQIGSQVCTVAYSGSLAHTAVFSLNSNDPVSFANLLGGVAFTNRTTLGFIDQAGTARAMGVEEPGGFGLSVATAGGLDAGAYAVAIAYVVGNEVGVLSGLSFINVPQGGGIQLALPTPIEANVSGINIYTTVPNGEVPYLRTRVPLGMTSYLVGRSPPSRVADTWGMSRMPPGNIVRYWRGRLLVARGSTLYFSEAMRYGITDPLHGFAQESRRIVLLEPVEGGVFVGTAAGVWFYRGQSPKDWVRVATDGAPPIAFTGTTVRGSEIGGDYQTSGAFVAMWLAENGFVIGRGDGSLNQPQATRIRLTADRGALVVHHRKAVAVVS